MDQITTHRKYTKEEKMEVDRTHTQDTSRNHHPLKGVKPLHGTSQGRGEEVGHRTPGKETQKGKQKRWDTPGERWRGWPWMDRKQWHSLVRAYAPSDQKGISK